MRIATNNTPKADLKVGKPTDKVDPKKKTAPAKDAAPAELKTLASKIKNLRQEIDRIEKGNLPQAEKDRLIKLKKTELAGLNRQLTAKGGKKEAVVTPNRNKAKKKDTPNPEDAPVKVEKKLKSLKAELAKAEKDKDSAANEVSDLKIKIHQLEARLRRSNKGGLVV